MNGLTIGEVAERAKVHIETLRYYEQRGLIASPPRSTSNYRLYPEDTVRRVRFIKHAQELGFSLREIKELLSLRAEPRPGVGRSVSGRWQKLTTSNNGFVRFNP